MTWWAWAIIYLLILIGSVYVLFRIARTLLRQAVALGRELGRAAEVMGEVNATLGELTDRLTPPEPTLAVFSDPVELRRRREREIKRRVRSGRTQARRAPLRPVRRRDDD